MLDEVALRGPNFREGYPVVLADGGTWQIPRPLVRYLPGRSGAGFRTVVMIHDEKSDYDKLLAQFDDSENPNGQINAIFDMAKLLLSSNYTLSDDQFDELLIFGVDEVGDPECARIFNEVRAITLGNGPKPVAAGGA